MPRVFAPQIPSRFDKGMRVWVPTVNMRPAERFGELIVLLTPDAYRIAPAPMVQALKERMDDFTADDYIVAIGNPTLIAAASCIAARKTGGVLKLLTWDRMTSDYTATELKL